MLIYLLSTHWFISNHKVWACNFMEIMKTRMNFTDAGMDCVFQNSSWLAAVIHISKRYLLVPGPGPAITWTCVLQKYQVHSLKFSIWISWSTVSTELTTSSCKCRGSRPDLLDIACSTLKDHYSHHQKGRWCWPWFRDERRQLTPWKRGPPSRWPEIYIMLMTMLYDAKKRALVLNRQYHYIKTYLNWTWMFRFSVRVASG